MKNILLVDDNQYILESLALTLDDPASGYTILKAENGREAADILDRQPVDMVMTDLQMPVMNGYQLIEYMNNKHPSLPLLAMTADPSDEVVERLRSLGIMHCVEKPFNIGEVTRLIMESLSPLSIPAAPKDISTRYAAV